MQLAATRTIIFKKDEWSKLTSHDKRIEYAKGNSIPIAETRTGNLMIHLKYRTKILPLNSLIAIFLFNGGCMTTPFYLNMPNDIRELKNDVVTIINTNPASSLGKDGTVQEICFACDQIENDFEFSVDIYKKWSYQIHAGKLNDEFCYSDGLLHHKTGDVFNYTESILLNVMEVDCERYIVHCAAFGYL